MKWIYLSKSGNDQDGLMAAALASVLYNSEDKYNVVYSSNSAMYFSGLSNVVLGYPDVIHGDEITKLESNDNMPFEILCNSIASRLNLPIKDYKLYTGFVCPENEIDRQFAKLGNTILFCYYLYEKNTGLMPILENVVRQLKNRGYNSVTCGLKRETFIKGSYDFRELINVDELIKNRNSIKCIVTAMPLVKEIGRLLEIPVIFLFSHAYILYSAQGNIIKRVEDNDIDSLTSVLNSIDTYYVS